MRSVGAWTGQVLVGLTGVVATVWGSLVLYYLAPGPDWARSGAVALFLVVGLAVFAAGWLRRNRRAAAISYAMAFAGVLGVWASATPSNDRDWQTDVAVLPYATLTGSG